MKIWKISSIIILIFLITLSFSSSQTQVHATDRESFTSIVISQKGLDFIKDLLVTKAIASIIPLTLPKIETAVKIPILGNVRIVLSNITIYNIDVLLSYVKPGDTGVAIVASGTTCNLNANWFYEYRTWLLPVEISDHGSASVQVEGMEMGLTLGLEIEKGTLKLSLIDCGCYVQDISIKLDGGASWLYQRMINAFDEHIRSAIENAIPNKLKEGVSRLDSFLQSLPKEIPVDDHASLNVTFVDNPLSTSSSISFDINGLFTARNKASIPNYPNNNLQTSLICIDQSKMLGISVDETVFNSASALYYDAEFMQWIVDEVPYQSLLNTREWRFIIPQLYKKYPNDEMKLNISLSSPPVVRITEHSIDATVNADLIIDVLEADDVIPVACISLVIRGSGSVKISGNNLGVSVKLKDLTMSLKQSNIGNLRMYLIQPVVWTVIEIVFLPYVNAHLARGFPLPIIHGFTLQNAKIICSTSKITVCSDVAYVESHLNQLIIPFSNGLS